MTITDPTVTVRIAAPSEDVVKVSIGGGGGGAVDSVNGHIGVVVLTAGDVGADAAGAAAAAQAAAQAASDPAGTATAAVAAEATARATAVTNEATARATADSSEASARAAADTSEATARAAGDATNATAITNEAATRATADTTEVTARANADALLIPLTQKAAASGVASLDSGGHVPATQLPPLVLTHTFVVSSQAAMLALTSANTGDVAVRTDANETFILSGADPTILGNWTQLLFPGGGAVTSVNSRTGAVTGLAEASTTVSAGTGLSGGGDLSANRTISMPGVGSAGTFGDATHVVQITTDAQGRVSGATAIAVTGLAQSDIVGLVSALAGKQPLDADLTAIAALDSSTSGAIASDGAGWIKKTYAQFKTALGLVKADVGLGNADNTSDANKPVSTAQQTALDLKAPIANPAFTGSLQLPSLTNGQRDALTSVLGMLIYNSEMFCLQMYMGAGVWRNVLADPPVQFGLLSSTGPGTSVGRTITGSGLVGTITNPGGAAGNINIDVPFLTPTAVKTGNYTAVANDLVPCNTTSGGFTVTLPTTPGDKALVAIKHVIQGSTNVVTYACGGSDVINKAGGATSGTLPLLAQAVILQYKASTGIWYIIADDLALAQLDARFAPANPLATDTLWGAKGDLVVATANDAAARLAVGADGLQLVTDGSQSTGLKWGTSLPARFGGLRMLTHSYGSFNGNASLVGNFNNFIRRLAATLQIPVGEIDFWYHSGMLAGFPNIGDSTSNCGIGGVFRHAYPNHTYGAPNNTTPSASAKADPFLDVICLGVNDAIGGFWDPNWLAAMTNGLRAVMTRMRAGRIYAIDDAAITFGGSGWGAVLTDKNYVTFGKYKSTATLNDTCTFTIPTTYTGGPISLSLLGNPNAVTTVTTPINSTSATSVIVANRSVHPASGNFLIKIESEEMLVTAGQGAGAGTYTVTRAQNGTSAALHSGANLTVTRPTDSAYLDFTASTANLAGNGAGVAPVSVRGFDASGHFSISGQGSGGNPSGEVNGTDIQMVARFTDLTSADAGKTIVATLKNVFAGETFRPFDVIIGDVDPPTQLVVNQPAYVGGSAASVAFINNQLALIVAEFTNAYVVDVAGTYSNLFGATIQTATGTGESTIKITPNSASLCVISKGSVLRCASESFLVTAIDKTNGGANDGTWLLTVTTNYTGIDAPAGSVVSAGNVNHAIGAEIIDARPWALADGLHPSDYGHTLLAAQCITTIQTVPQTAAKIVTSGGYVAKDRQSWAAPVSSVAAIHYRPSLGTVRTTKLLVQNTEYCEPWKCEWNDALISAFLAYVTTGVATAVLRFGLYLDYGGYPGPLILDSGTVAAATSSVQVTLAAFQKLRAGWYWRSIVCQTAAPTVRANGIRTPIQGFVIPETDLSQVDSPQGVSRTGMSGALTDWPLTVPTLVRDNVTFPIIGLGLETFTTA